MQTLFRSGLFRKVTSQLFARKSTQTVDGAFSFCFYLAMCPLQQHCCIGPSPRRMVCMDLSKAFVLRPTVVVSIVAFEIASSQLWSCE